MTEYVISFVRPKQLQYWPDVLLIEKRKPAWQDGLFNLPGGKIEPLPIANDYRFESPEAAAVRELEEETGIAAPFEDATVLGKIVEPGATVYVVDIAYDSSCGRNPIEHHKTIEHVFWMRLDEALKHEKLIPNLRFIIPLCVSRAKGWTLSSQGEGFIVRNKCASPST